MITMHMIIWGSPWQFSLKHPNAVFEPARPAKPKYSAGCAHRTHTVTCFQAWREMGVVIRATDSSNFGCTTTFVVPRLLHSSNGCGVRSHQDKTGVSSIGVGDAGDQTPAEVEEVDYLEREPFGGVAQHGSSGQRGLAIKYMWFY